MTAALEWAKLGHTTPRPLTAMSEEQHKGFEEAVKADAGLQEKLSAAKDADAVVAIAKAAGFEISVEELARAQAELSDEQLSGVSGAGLFRDRPDSDYGEGHLTPCLADVSEWFG